MTDDLLPYYGRELAFIRRLGAEFAEANPKIAGRLLLGPDSVDDPHVARLVESFALLNARTRKKLDDDFPELTQAMLSVLYPHYLAPIPSMAIVQFVGLPDLTTGHTIPRGTSIETDPIHGDPCRFRTVYPATTWPIEVESAKLTGRPLVAPPGKAAHGAVASLRIVLRCRAPDMTFAALAPQSLRFFLRGPAEQSQLLYELLANDAVGVAVARSPEDTDAQHLPETAIVPVGFAADEGLLPYPSNALPGYRLLTEYFAFPAKFLFVDITGLTGRAQAQAGNRLEIYVYLRRGAPDLERVLGPESLALGCTPVVNLYRHRAEPIRLTHEETEYRVVADARRPLATEIYSVDRVVATSSNGDEESYLPFFSVRHAVREAARSRFFTTTRRPAAKRRGVQIPGTELYLTLVDIDFDPAVPADWVLDIETTCLNRDLPGRLPFGGDQPRLQITEGAAPLESMRCLTQPTQTLRPSLGRGLLWRLISHLSLNHLSIADGEVGADALREILKLYDFRDSAETRSVIEGIDKVVCRSTSGRSPLTGGVGICRGTEVRVEFDPERYSGNGLFLFASVLERYLALYCNINSFVRMVAAVKGREAELRRWAPRAGRTPLL